MSLESRRVAHGFGLKAESLCALGLRLRGYRVLARRFKVPVGEVDIVARRGRTLVFLEVKARANVADAAEALTYRQRRRILAAAKMFLARHPQLATLDARFDVMLVAPWRWPHHVVDAWRE
jgi:putative endonuclease